MAVYKEINRADGSGVTTFYRISDILDTAETDDKESQSVVIDYNQAQNKPSINGVALVGNKTSEDLGLQPAGDYITNNEADEKFIDEDELEAKNYVNQTELQDAIAHIEHFHREIVEALPVTGMDNVLYMVRKGGTGEDIYNEYIWVGLSNSENGYEFLGTTATDLTDYYKKSQVDAALATKVDKEGGKGLSEENYTLAEKTKLAGLKNYDDTEIQAEVSGLNTDMNNLKKSNVTISNTLAELKPDVDSNTAAVSTIYDLLDNKMTAIRLVEQGDGWIWMNLEGSRLTYAQASAALGHENCMLFIEQLENDGKVIPAEYKSEGDHINIIFKDLDSLVHIMTCGEDDVVVTKDVTTTNGQVDFIVEDEAIGYTTKMTALYGKSTQATRSGKNLFNKNSIPSQNGATKEVLKTGVRAKLINSGNYRYFSIELGKSEFLGKTITLIRTITNSASNIGQIALYFGNETSQSKKIIFANKESGTSNIYIPNTFPEDCDRIWVLFYGNVSGTGNVGDYVDYTNLMITVGDTLETYEDYGVSPSPDYPSPIESITEISATVTGKNLFDGTGWRLVQSGNGFPTPSTGATIISSDKNNISFTSTQWTYAGVESGFIKVKANETYTFSASFTTPTNRFFITQYNESKVRLSTLNSIVNPLQNTTFTTTNDGYIAIAFTNTTTAQTTYKIENIQLEKSTQASSYEEYKSNSLTINLQGNELCSIGDVKDELVVENGRAKIIKKVGKVVLNGSEGWIKGINAKGLTYFYHGIDDRLIGGPNPFVSNFTVGSFWTSESYINMAGFSGGNTAFNIILEDTSITTADGFKQWLSTHNTEVYYVLETPIDIEITDPTLLAQLNALEQITQYKHTYITITGDDLTPEADFTYINNVVINNTDSVLGKDTYWNDEVPTQQDLPSKAQEGEIRIVQDTEDIYIYNGTKWVPFDKNSEVDLSNYLTKDNTTPWVPTGPFNPSTKKYVDDSVGGIHVPTKTSQLQNDSGFVIKTTNELTNYYTKNNTYTKNEVDALVAGGSGASDSSDLTNKPKINNVELSGNKSLSDLGITNLNNVLDGKAIGSARTIGAKDSEGQPLGVYAWAEGQYTIASGDTSHAEGGNTRASGYISHAEGMSTKALGDYSHAEGNQTEASGDCSHAEGIRTTASSSSSHAEGDNTTASGTSSHAEGLGTTAQGNNQHVQGKYNISDTTSAHIVGNGTKYNARSNAHTLDWSGNAWFAGDVYTGSTSGKNKDDGSKKLATEEYVDNSVNGIVESGSNNYGNWIKFEDGTMICTRTITVTIDCTNSWGSLYYGENYDKFNFAQSFIEPPILNLQYNATGSLSFIPIAYSEIVIDKDGFKKIEIARPTSATGVSVEVYFIAIGKWK